MRRCGLNEWDEGRNNYYLLKMMLDFFRKKFHFFPHRHIASNWESLTHHYLHRHQLTIYIFFTHFIICVWVQQIIYWPWSKIMNQKRDKLICVCSSLTWLAGKIFFTMSNEVFIHRWWLCKTLWAERLVVWSLNEIPNISNLNWINQI